LAWCSSTSAKGSRNVNHTGYYMLCTGESSARSRIKIRKRFEVVRRRVACSSLPSHNHPFRIDAAVRFWRARARPPARLAGRHRISPARRYIYCLAVCVACGQCRQWTPQLLLLLAPLPFHCDVCLCWCRWRTLDTIFSFFIFIFLVRVEISPDTFGVCWVAWHTRAWTDPSALEWTGDIPRPYLISSLSLSRDTTTTTTRKNGEKLTQQQQQQPAAIQIVWRLARDPLFYFFD
jgi:hypothetical protein